MPSPLWTTSESFWVRYNLAFISLDYLRKLLGTVQPCLPLSGLPQKAFRYVQPCLHLSGLPQKASGYSTTLPSPLWTTSESFWVRYNLAYNLAFTCLDHYRKPLDEGQPCLHLSGVPQKASGSDTTLPSPLWSTSESLWIRYKLPFTSLEYLRKPLDEIQP